MGTIFAYSISSSIILTAMYLIYKWMLADENQHSYNRAILWVIYICALVLPIVTPSLSDIFASQSAISAEKASIEISSDLKAIEIVESNPLLPRILSGIYILGIIIGIIHTILIVIKLTRTISSGTLKEVGTYTIVVIEDARLAPFSWLKYIVMSRNDYESSADVIIAHESRHLELYHQFDLVAAQIITILQWFNPSAWLMREELKTVHEYQADAGVIASGANYNPQNEMFARFETKRIFS